MSSSSSLERIGVTLGVVVGVEGAMVSLLLLLIVACICDAAQFQIESKNKPEAEKCSVG